MSHEPVTGLVSCTEVCHQLSDKQCNQLQVIEIHSLRLSRWQIYEAVALTSHLVDLGGCIASHLRTYNIFMHFNA